MTTPKLTGLYLDALHVQIVHDRPLYIQKLKAKQDSIVKEHELIQATGVKGPCASLKHPFSLIKSQTLSFMHLTLHNERDMILELLNKTLR